MCEGHSNKVGEVTLHHKDGWTAISWWDRSVDKRPGSNSAIIAEGTWTIEETLSFGRESFPAVFERQRVSLKLPV